MHGSSDNTFATVVIGAVGGGQRDGSLVGRFSTRQAHISAPLCPSGAPICWLLAQQHTWNRGVRRRRPFNVSRTECCSTVQSQLEWTSVARQQCIVECTHVLGCSVRLWWIFALTRCADNSGLGPSNLHALHIIVRPTMWSFLLVSTSVDNRCPVHNPPFQFLSCVKGSGHQPVRIFWTWHGL